MFSQSLQQIEFGPKRVRQPFRCGTILLLLLAPCAAALNQLDNPGFEAGVTPWSKVGGGTLKNSLEAHTGSSSGLLTGRTVAWDGISRSLLGLLQPGKTYWFSGWVKIRGSPSERVTMTVMQQDGYGQNFHHIYWADASVEGWTSLSGYFSLEVLGSLESLLLIFEGPAAGVDLYLDDVRIEEFNWKTAANQAIGTHRQRFCRLELTDPAGQPWADVPLKVRQLRHRFGYGSAIDYHVLTDPEYAAFFRRYFEWATPDSDLKWYVNEPERGRLDYGGADAIIQFCRENDITIRGHSIFWAGEAFVPAWLKDLAPVTMEQAVRARVENVVTRYRGQLAHWEVNNEMLEGTFFTDHLPQIDSVPVHIWMFRQTQALDPNCALFVNDYGAVEGDVYLDSYQEQIRNLIAGGARVDGIGLQCHMDANYNRGLVMTRLGRMAELGLPLWITEFDVDEPDPVRRARDLEDLYRLCMAQPRVRGILMYGFWKDAHWRPNGHIVESDWKLNQAGRRYDALLKEWSTNLEGNADENGLFEFRGYHGSIEVKIFPPGNPPVIRIIELEPGEEVARFAISLDSSPTGIPGDLNGDGKVDEQDLQLCYLYWLWGYDLQDFAQISSRAAGDLSP